MERFVIRNDYSGYQISKIVNEIGGLDVKRRSGGVKWAKVKEINSNSKKTSKELEQAYFTQSYSKRRKMYDDARVLRQIENKKESRRERYPRYK